MNTPIGYLLYKNQNLIINLRIQSSQTYSVDGNVPKI